MIRTLIPTYADLLHSKIEKCSYNLDREELSQRLKVNMDYYKGVGLSANQIGINERAFIMIRDMEYNETITCFNPKIIKESKNKVVMEEGCLSYPELFLDVVRPSSVVVKYEDEYKKRHKLKLSDFPARVFQHEYDHMEGIDFTERSK